MLYNKNLVGDLNPTRRVGYQTEFQVLVIYSIFKLTDIITDLNNKNHHPVKHHQLFLAQIQITFLNTIEFHLSLH